MHIVFVLFEWLLVLALIGFIGAIGLLVVSALSLKNGVMRNAKRLYEPPVRSVKTLVATAKGLAQQEGVRFKHVAGTVRVAAGAVKVAAAEVKTAAQGVHFSDLKPVMANVQTVLKVITLAFKLTRSSAVKAG